MLPSFVFFKLAEQEKTVFWKVLFEEMGLGIFPKNLLVDDKSNMKFENECFIMENREITPVLNEILKVFLEKVVSVPHVSDHTVWSELDGLESDGLVFSKIRKKSCKDMILTQYALDLKAKYNLSDKHYVKTFAMLQLYTTLRWIDTSAIKIRKRQDDYKIDSIEFPSFI